MQDEKGIKISQIQDIYLKNKKILLLIGLLLLVYIIGGMFIGSFLSLEQLLLTTQLAFPIIFFALSQMIVVSTGKGAIDLSVGYIATIVAIFSALIMNGNDQMIFECILLALALGGIFGLLNGLLIAYVKLPPLIVTMAMASIIEGIINVIVALGFNITGTAAPLIRGMVTGHTGIMPNIIFVIIITIVIVTIIMKKTKIGLKFLSIGANDTAAYLTGVNVKRVRCTAFIVSGCLAGLTGILLIGNSAYAFKEMGSAYVLPSYAAVVVGGVSLQGGESDYLGVVIGAIVLQSLVNLFVGLGWGDAGKWVGYSVILLIMLILYARNKRNR